MNDIKFIVEKFRKGCVGIFPTDTAYGIGCRMDDVVAVERVYKLRNRPFEKALIVLMSDIEMVEEYVLLDDRIKDFVKKYWPGGLTIILKCKINKVLKEVRADGNTLAVRIPQHDELREVIKGIGIPIVAPSANYSGGKTPYEFSEVDKSLISKVDFTMKGMCTIKGVSTIIDATKSPWQIVRQGVVVVKDKLIK